MAGDAFGGQGPAIVAVGWSFFAVTTVLMLLRIHVWRTITRHGTWALIWTSVAYVTTTVELISVTICVSYGLGSDMTTIVQGGHVSTFLVWAWITCWWYVLNVALGKVAAAAFLIAVHGDAYPWRRYLLHFIAISNIVFAIPDLFLVWFHCNPTSALWDLTRQDQCNIWVVINYTRFSGSWSAFTDVVMSIMPVILVYHLPIQRRLKFGLCCLMGLGIFAAAAACMDTYYLSELASPNFSRDVADLMCWGKATTWLVLIATSVPPAWPLINSKVSPHGRRQMSHRSQPSFVQLEDQLETGQEAASAPGAASERRDRKRRTKSVRVAETLERDTGPATADSHTMNSSTL